MTIPSPFAEILLVALLLLIGSAVAMFWALIWFILKSQPPK